MQICRFCKNVIQDNEPYCQYCGYDPKTDTVSQDFKSMRELGITTKKKSKKAKYSETGGVSSGIKKFAFIGVVILIFSIFYKNNFDINSVISEVKYTFTMLSKGKFKIWQKKTNKQIQWIDVRTFD